MRRVGLVLAVGAVALALTPGAASAQSEEPTLGCIPTSDTPFQTGLVGPLPFATALLLFAGPPGSIPTIVGSTTTVSPEGLASFAAGIAPGTYAVAFVGRFGFFRLLGSLQIGGCLPASKAQCAQGGWQTFDFKNQGQCIALVNRGEKP